MRRLFAVTAIAALTLFSTACGSDEKKTSSTQEENDNDEPAAADNDTDGTDADDGDRGDVPDLSAQCAAFEQRFQDEFDFNNLDDIRDAMQEMKSFTPDDIDDDIDVLSGVYGDMKELIDEAGGDASQAFTDPKFLERLEAMDSAEVQEATENVAEFFEKACPDLES